MDAETPVDKQLVGVRVFIVEDESLIMMLLEDILADLGCTIAASASSLAQGLMCAAAVDAQVAILDINLNGEAIFPVAEQLAKRKIPMIFASGYGATMLPESWRGWPTLPKPFSTEQVVTALRNALSGAGA